MLKHLFAMQETQVRSMGWEDPLEKEMATQSRTLAWKIPWMDASHGQPSAQWGNVPCLPAKLGVSASLPTTWPRWGVGP